MTATIERTPQAGTGRVPARTRGRLVLEKKVIERVAAKAATESDTGLTGGVSGGFLGFGTHADLGARPATTVELVGRTATVQLEVTIAYPTPIRAATDAIRRQVTDRVHELTGVRVTRVDIAVSALRAVDPATTRTVQ
ncbi:MAG: Asp23/Gls24 family envelope stress response protein [Lapillicoccus sp.]